MAKATIVFDLENDRDLRDYNLYNNSGGMFDALFEISCNLKKKMRFASEKINLNSQDTLDVVFDAIEEILDDNNVKLEKLK